MITGVSSRKLPCMFDCDSFPTQIPVVHFVHRIIRIPSVIKLHKAVAILQVDVADLSEAFKKSFHISFTCSVAQTANKDTTTRHFRLVENKLQQSIKYSQKYL